MPTLRHPPFASSATVSPSSNDYYPSLQCCINHQQTTYEVGAFKTPHDHLTHLANRVHLLEHGAIPMAIIVCGSLSRFCQAMAGVKVVVAGVGAHVIREGKVWHDANDGMVVGDDGIQAAQLASWSRMRCPGASGHYSIGPRRDPNRPFSHPLIFSGPANICIDWPYTWPNRAQQQ